MIFLSWLTPSHSAKLSKKCGRFNNLRDGLANTHEADSNPPARDRSDSMLLLSIGSEERIVTQSGASFRRARLRWQLPDPEAASRRPASSLVLLTRSGHRDAQVRR